MPLKYAISIGVTTLFGMSFVGGAMYASALLGDAPTGDAHLYQDKGSGLVHRAVFDHAPDCELVRNYIMQHEPMITWFCAGKLPLSDEDE